MKVKFNGILSEDDALNAVALDGYALQRVKDHSTENKQFRKNYENSTTNY